MDQPPSTTSSPRTARQAIKTGVALLSALAVPVVLVAASAGRSGTQGLERQLVASRQIHTEDASPAVRFVDSSTAFSTGLGTHVVNGELTGIHGLGSDAVSRIPAAIPTPPAIPAPAAPTTTTTPPTTTPPAAPAPVVKAQVVTASAVTPAPTPAPAAVAPGGLAYADPADPATWDRLAQCEAGGNWARNSGNGYYGGLQFSAGTWRAVGGTGLPSQNSRETQIAMGQRLQARSGWGQWPACTRKLHYR